MTLRKLHNEDQIILSGNKKKKSLWMSSWRISCCGEKIFVEWKRWTPGWNLHTIVQIRQDDWFQHQKEKLYNSGLTLNNGTQLVSRGPSRSSDWDVILKSRKIKTFLSPLLVVREGNPAYCEMMRVCCTCNKPSDLRGQQPPVKVFNGSHLTDRLLFSWQTALQDFSFPLN